MKESFLSRYTPSLLTPETLEAIFVQRKSLAKKLVERILESAKSENKHYSLLIGPRGIGKTHLVSLVYHRVRKDPVSNDKLMIAWLREEEWGVASFLDFLLTLLRALQEEYPDAEIAERCRALYKLQPREAELAAEELLRNVVGDKTLLVITENLDETFRGLENKGQHKLRAYIENNPFFTILATSQSLFSGVSVRKSPFYGFFETHHLREFSFEDVVTMLTKIAVQEGDKELASFIRTPAGRARIRAVHHLAAGNPRVYVILAQFLTCESLTHLIQPLMQTLDDLTPYYQGRMNYLSPQQRKIVEFLCERRRAVSVAEIAERNFLSHQTASGQLKKLRDMGYARAHQAGRESFYELREPLMRISLEVKKLRGEPIQLLVQFLQLWYSRTELTKRLESLTPQAEYERAYLTQALKQREEESEDPTVSACLEDYWTHNDKTDFKRALRVAEELIEIRGYTSDRLKLAECLDKLGRVDEAERAKKKALESELAPKDANSWRDRADVLRHVGRHEEAVTACDKALELEPESAVAWGLRANCLGALDRYEEALTSVEKALELDATDERLWINRSGYLGRVKRYQEGLDSADKALEIDPKNSWSWLARAVCLGHVARPEEVLASIDESLELHPKYALAWQYRAETLEKLKRYEEALESNAKGLALDPKDTLAWQSRARCLERLERHEESLESIDKSLELDPKDPSAWGHRGVVLAKLHRYEEMLDAAEEALELTPDDADLSRARASLLYLRGRLDESLTYCDRAVELHPQDARAWGNRGETLSALGRHEEALASFDTALELRDAQDSPDSPQFQEHSNRAVVLMLLGRWDEGAAALDDALERLSQSNVEDEADVAIVGNMLIRTRDATTWRRFIPVWLELFAKHNLLSALGQGVVDSIPRVSISWITDQDARAWRDVWQEMGSAHKELALPLRLLNAAVEYRAKPDKRILLGLPAEERKILESLLGIPKSERTT